MSTQTLVACGAYNHEKPAVDIYYADGPVTVRIPIAPPPPERSDGG